MGEGAKLIAQAFMKEKALNYSKSFTSPLWMWRDERRGASKKGEEACVGGDRDSTCGVRTKFTCSPLDTLIGKLDWG